MKRKVNYLMGALKRKYETGPVQTEPGFFINKVNQKERPLTKEQDTKTELGIKGLV